MLDVTPPTSSVQPLPPAEPNIVFTLSWSGATSARAFRTTPSTSLTMVVPSRPSSPTRLQPPPRSPANQASAFWLYSIARDLVGNVSPAKTVAEATTFVGLIAPTVTFVGAPTSAAFTTPVSLSAPRPTPAPSRLSLQVEPAELCRRYSHHDQRFGHLSLTANWAADSTYNFCHRHSERHSNDGNSRSNIHGSTRHRGLRLHLHRGCQTNASTTAIITATGACTSPGLPLR